ncbi:hypothetical protein JTB14_037077 [Gonioctena quinquepunctata]|nr:hypothetical protein JTB14_037077 [Gonioctena quinquepunctata]
MDIMLIFFNNNPHIHATNIQEHEEIREILNKNKIGYFSHPQENKKENALVRKGLEFDNPNDVTEALKHEYSLEVKIFYKMRKTVRPIFLIITNDKTTLDKLKGEIKIISNRQVT